MTRITDKNVRRACAHYARMLGGHGWGRAQHITYRAPYGQVTYILTDDGNGIEHDVPGFTGSGGSGFVPPREAHARILSAASAIADYARATGREYDDDTGSIADVAGMDRLGLGSEVHATERASVEILTANV